MVDIVTPATPAELDAVRNLMRSFVAWHRERHLEDLDLIERYFDKPAFEEELASLPGKYAPPAGALLLAMHDGSPAGCVALRQIDQATCEMKRMFVYPEYHGLGIGSALAEAIIEQARTLNYETMLLDTSVKQSEAQALYRRFGFRKIGPYYDLPGEIRDWLVFMALPLRADAPPESGRNA
jgi:GNAT superfamily N-acetyltransferase